MFCEIDGARLHYLEIGQGKPVVLLHGFELDHAVMEGCMEPVFAQRSSYRRIYVDLPGMGRSEAPQAFASSDAVLDLLCRFIEKTVEGKFLLVGESYGGYLAQAVLSQMPERVDGMLLLCPVVYPEPEKRTVQQNVPHFLDENTDQRFLAEIASGLGRADKPFTDALWQNYACSYDVPAANRRLRFSRPLLLIAGRQDDCVGYKDLWGLLEDYPRASFAVLDRAGHNLQIEQPELFSSLADEWLARTELE